jgi:hypothetical protein
MGIYIALDVANVRTVRTPRDTHWNLRAALMAAVRAHAARLADLDADRRTAPDAADGRRGRPAE